MVNPYLEELKEEKEELNLKIEQLRDFLKSGLFNGLSEEAQDLLDTQSLVMMSYSNILEMRIKILNNEENEG